MPNHIHLIWQLNELNGKEHENWQRDAIGIEIYSKKFAKQKLYYIHLNPIRGKWSLAKNHLSYHYSSVRFYEFGTDEFDFLKNVFWEF